MGAPKYDIWVDPGAKVAREKLWGIADQIGTEANSMSTHSDITDIGNSELSKIKNGQFGDTMFAGNLKQQATRQRGRIANDYSLGANAMSAGNPNSQLIMQRQKDKANRRVDEASNDALSQGMVGYTDAAGRWSQTDNNLKQQKIGALGAQAGVTNAGWQAQHSGTQYTKKKSGWQIFKEVLGVGLNIAGLAMGMPGAGGLGGLLSGGGGGNGGPPPEGGDGGYG